MTKEEINEQMKFYEDKDNLEEVQQRLNNKYKSIRDILVLEYIEIVQNIDDEQEKNKLIEMLNKKGLYPVKSVNDKYIAPEVSDVVVFDKDFELKDIAYDFQRNIIAINPVLISNFYQSYLKLANRQIRNTGVKEKKDIKNNMDVMSYLYNNNISFEEYVSLLLPHESIHQWTFGIHNMPQSNNMGFIDEGTVEGEARRICDKYSIDSIRTRMVEVEATNPLLSRMNHNQKIQMMMTSNYRQVFNEYFENIETINRYIRRSYSSSSDLLIDRFVKYDSISLKKVNTLSNDLINGNTKELEKIKKELDENSLFAKFKIPSADKPLTLQQIGQGTTQSFSQNPGEAMKVMDVLEDGVRTREQLKKEQIQGE